MKRENWIVSILLGLFAISAVGVLWPGAGRDKKNAVAAWDTPMIGVIDINGPIDANSSGMFDTGGFSRILTQIQTYRDDNQVKAIILRINSPGGTVGASQEIFREIKLLKKETGKPVIVSISDVGASGAYWIALVGDSIFANPGSMVGSVGVIMSSPDLSEVQDRYGVGMRTLKSGKYKDLLNNWRPTTAEETQLLQSMIDDVHGQFINAVIQERKIPTLDAIQLSQGQIYSGRQAKALGLIDQLGGLSDAVEYAKRRAKLGDDAEVIQHTGSPMEDFIQRYIGASVRSVATSIRAIGSPTLR